MLVQCWKHLRQKHEATETSEANPSTPPKAVDSMKRVTLFLESAVYIEMLNKLVPNANGKLIITGQADWALGYSPLGSEGSLLIAIEAKQRSKFSEGENQLIAYLAADGIVQQSRIFNVNFRRDLKIVFNFIITMMETAMKSTLTAMPTKPGHLQEKEINHYKKEVWSKVYAIKDSDDDMEDESWI